MELDQDWDTEKDTDSVLLIGSVGVRVREVDAVSDAATVNVVVNELLSVEEYDDVKVEVNKGVDEAVVFREFETDEEVVLDPDNEVLDAECMLMVLLVVTEVDWEDE